MIKTDKYALVFEDGAMHSLHDNVRGLEFIKEPALGEYMRQ